MPETTLEPPSQTPPPPATTTPNPFETPKVEPKALEAPPSSNFMADLAKAFKTTARETPPEPPKAETPPTEATAPPTKEPEPPTKTTEPPETFTPKAKERWRGREKEWDSERTAFQTKQKELEAALQDAKRRMPELESQLAGATEMLAERNKALERFDVERSDAFKERVLDPEESVKGRLAKQELQPNEIAALLSGNLTQREQALENPRFSSYRKSQVIQLLDKWDEIQDTKNQMVTNGRKGLEEYTRQQAEAESARRAQFLREAQAVYDDQVVQLMNKLEPFGELPGDANNKDWNQAVTVRKQLAHAIYSGAMDRQQLAQAAIWAAAGPTYRQLLQMALTKIQELSTAVDKMRGVQPGVRDSGGDTQIIQPPRPASEGDFMKDIVARFNKEKP